MYIPHTQNVRYTTNTHQKTQASGRYLHFYSNTVKTQNIIYDIIVTIAYFSVVLSKIPHIVGFKNQTNC